ILLELANHKLKEFEIIGSGNISIFSKNISFEINSSIDRIFLMRFSDVLNIEINNSQSQISIVLENNTEYILNINTSLILNINFNSTSRMYLQSPTVNLLNKLTTIGAQGIMWYKSLAIISYDYHFTEKFEVEGAFSVNFDWVFGGAIIIFRNIKNIHEVNGHILDKLETYF
ncbi:MAG: hypothetical protein ACTSRP_24660, partial [Candidatus Helarchaeota archaeon]